MRTRTRITATGTALAVLGVTAVSAAPSSAQTAYPIPNANQPAIVGNTATIAPGATDVTLPANVTEVTATVTESLTIKKAGDLDGRFLGPGDITIVSDGQPAKYDLKSSGSGVLAVEDWVDKGGSSVQSAGPLKVTTVGTGAGSGTSKLSSDGGSSTIDLAPKSSGRNATSRAAGSGFIAYVVKTSTDRDVITGGNGKLSAYAGAGNDVIRAGAGGGRLSGQAGNDTIKGGTGTVSIFGGAGNDKLYAAKAKSTISGGAGNDYSSSVNGAIDTISGGSGKDKARAGKRDKVARSVESVTRSAKN